MLCENALKKYNKRLLLSRMRILMNNGFYGLLLMQMIFAVDEKCETAATDGYRIYFGPKFMDDLSDSELDFVLMHEIMHAALNHCKRRDGRESEMYNIACDIVVNSNILYSNNFNNGSITLRKYGETMHIAPNGDEGYKYTAEEVYEMLVKRCGKNDKCKWDDHSRWTDSDDDSLGDAWLNRIEVAAETIKIRKPMKGFGGTPLLVERMLGKIRNPQIDWRTILDEFIQTEINDYSFTPPDRRFGDCDFFLPDLNVKKETVEKLWFLVDTSGSISDNEIAAAYSEICGAIEQYDGALTGMLSFTESHVTEPVPFENVEELLKIKPVGGGGNDFGEIFRYMKKYMTDDLPVYIIIITDGYDIFPKEKLAMGVPVLWLINNEDVNPPWGKVARIKVEENDK